MKPVTTVSSLKWTSRSPMDKELDLYIHPTYNVCFESHKLKAFSWRLLVLFSIICPVPQSCQRFDYVRNLPCIGEMFVDIHFICPFFMWPCQSTWPPATQFITLVLTGGHSRVYKSIESLLLSLTGRKSVLLQPTTGSKRLAPCHLGVSRLLTGCSLGGERYRVAEGLAGGRKVFNQAHWLFCHRHWPHGDVTR